jgi:hypothetical protein
MSRHKEWQSGVIKGKPTWLFPPMLNKCMHQQSLNDQNDKTRVMTVTRSKMDRDFQTDAITTSNSNL